MDLGVHLPLMQFGEEPLSLRRLEATVDAARDCGFAAVSANDHLVFQTPWLDGLAALASIAGRSGELTLATTVSLAVLRGPVPLAKALTALDGQGGTFVELDEASQHSILDGSGGIRARHTASRF